MDDVRVRRVAAGDEDLLRTTRLHALADSPAAFGTDLATARGRDDSFWAGQVRGRLGESECATWIAVDSSGAGVGMLAAVVGDDAIDVIQVWVDVAHRGTR